MRLDLHCHTSASPDSLNTLDAILHRMERRRIDVLAITDHNLIDAALDFQRQLPDRFLVGEEIKTTEGELLALFITEWVPPRLSPEETIDLVHEQGGLVGASHPLDRLRREAMGSQVLDAIHHRLDFVEVMNARVIFPATTAGRVRKQRAGACPVQPAAMPIRLSRWDGATWKCPASTGRTIFSIAWLKRRSAAG